MKNKKNYYKILIESEKKEMLEMNLESKITNINYLRYMEYKENENEALKRNLESERATQTENNTQK